MNKKPVIGILIGDASGIGPELTAKLASEHFFDTCCRPIIIGDARVFESGLRIIDKQVPYTVITDADDADWVDGIPLLDQGYLDPAHQIVPGRGSRETGEAAVRMLKKAADLVLEHKIQGFAVAPCNKAAITASGSTSENEIHLLADYLGFTGPFGEVNMAGNFLAARVTSHIPLDEVSSHVTEKEIHRALDLLHGCLVCEGRNNPVIGVAALNPHAGGQGLCGREEIEVISPAIASARDRGIDAQGPVSADILFIKAFAGEYDGVVTMYHDQGQIALKLKGFDQGVTIYGELPVPGVTCAHGTAYDIAGKGIANTAAFKNAVLTACCMAENMKIVGLFNA